MRESGKTQRLPKICGHCSQLSVAWSVIQMCFLNIFAQEILLLLCSYSQEKMECFYFICLMEHPEQDKVCSLSIYFGNQSYIGEFLTVTTSLSGQGDCLFYLVSRTDMSQCWLPPGSQITAQRDQCTTERAEVHSLSPPFPPLLSPPNPPSIPSPCPHPSPPIPSHPIPFPPLLSHPIPSHAMPSHAILPVRIQSRFLQFSNCWFLGCGRDFRC